MYVGGDGGLIDLSRKTILDDDVDPKTGSSADCLWSDTELFAYLNLITNELYEETFLVEDSTTVALTQIKLLSNLGNYDLDERVLNVKDGAKLSVNTNTNYGVLKRTTEAFMDQWKTTWREITDTTTPLRYIPDPARKSLTIYPKFDDTGEVVGASNITFIASSKKISTSDTDEDFTEHYVVGDEINISGTDDNEGYVTATVVTATEITVSETLVNESLTSATLRKVCDTLLMVVNRLPLTAFTTADIDASPAVSPEFKSKYHHGLIYGIGREAFLKPDSQTLNPQASEMNGKRWEAFKNKIKHDLAPFTRSERQGKSGTSGIWKGI